jgi:hypothetical protein
MKQGVLEPEYHAEFGNNMAGYKGIWKHPLRKGLFMPYLKSDTPNLQIPRSGTQFLTLFLHHPTADKLSQGQVD